MVGGVLLVLLGALALWLYVRPNVARDAADLDHAIARWETLERTLRITPKSRWTFTERTLERVLDERLPVLRQREGVPDSESAAFHDGWEASSELGEASSNADLFQANFCVRQLNRRIQHHRARAK